jgi:uncharacterized membrane protein
MQYFLIFLLVFLYEYKCIPKSRAIPNASWPILHSILFPLSLVRTTLERFRVKLYLHASGQECVDNKINCQIFFMLIYAELVHLTMFTCLPTLRQYYRVIALILRNIVLSSMSYCTISYDILRGTIFLNIGAITLL